MEALLAKLVYWAQLTQAVPLVRSAGKAMLIATAFFLVVLFFERRAGVDVRRYRSRNFLNDVVYTLFYKGGFYNVLLLALVTNAVSLQMPFLQLNLLRDLPWYVGLAVFWIAGDLAIYWWHRLQHANRFLWALHSVHHSQQRLNLFTASRRHPLENLMLDVLIYAMGFHMVLGIPTQGWLPLAVTIACVAGIQHAELDWRFGPLYRVIVSPKFHAFHHSVDPAHANANYGFLFSAWDYLFGTAASEQQRPAQYGVDGIDFHESLISQLVKPFHLMWRWRDASTPLTDDPTSGSAGLRAASNAPGP
jgi:sterol desaturase/sphingolipid hydroxylase (fatty acid hydroxylase superfamily)